MSGRESHHAAKAFVHSNARRRSYRPTHSRITAQYTIPVVIGPTSSAVTETITASSRATPVVGSPIAISA